MFLTERKSFNGIKCYDVSRMVQKGSLEVIENDCWKKTNLTLPKTTTKAMSKLSEMNNCLLVGFGQKSFFKHRT